LGLEAEALATLARRAGDADAAIAAWAETAFAESVAIDGFGAATLSADFLTRLPRAVGTKMLGAILAKVGGEQRPRALAILERLHQRLTADGDLKRLTTLGVVLGRRGEKLWFAREPGRRAPVVAHLGPRESVLWDRRFRIDNSGRSSVDVQMARTMSRRDAEHLVGQRIVAPAAAIRSAPLVKAGDGRPLALGTHRFDDSVAVVFSSEYCLSGAA
jgi:tRNA(Ile)-lysidine synthase